MSKVICDVCGTAYPETASQCPICGCAKPEDARPVSSDASTDAGSVNTYTYVKGGRFSKSNVRKRNKLAAQQREPDPDVQEPEQTGSNNGLIIAIVMLALAIVAVIGYILVNFFGWGSSGKPTEPAQTTTVATTQEQTTEDTSAIGIVCTGLSLATDTVELTAIDDAWLLNPIPTPEDTTDPMTYVSSDTSVATVNDEGRVTAVGAGEAVITVACGEASVTCTVICNIETEPTTEETTEATTEPTTAPVVDGNWRLNREDFTLSAKGATWELYRGDVSKNLITFSSDDETVATFENGVVTAVGPGHTTVRAKYGDKELSCKVHCAFKADPTEPTEEETTEPTVEETTEATEPVLSGTYSIHINGTDVAVRKYKNEVTLAPGKTFQLTLVDTQSDKTVDVDWVSGNEKVCTVEGSTVTGVAKGNTTITVTFDGKTYECIIHVTG